MIEHEFIKSFSVFRKFMTGNNVPNYVMRYCINLDEKKWKWFYEQVKAALVFTTDIDRFFYVLKWILKYNFVDLTYELFFQDYMDSEICCKSLIKDQWQKFLNEKYYDHLAKDIDDIQTG